MAESLPAIAAERSPAQNLAWLKALVKRHKLDKVFAGFLADPRLPLWTGAPNVKRHHYGKGRLIEHIAEVTELAMLNNLYLKLTSRVNERLLVCACIAHDWGKLWDYQPVGEGYEEWTKAPHVREIHHISRSAIEFNLAAKDVLSEQAVYDVTHAILAHHGCKEWGSPVIPQTGIAWLLHLCDGISARMDDSGRGVEQA